MSEKITINSNKIQYEDNFIRVKTAYYQGGNNHEGEWTYIERTGETRAAVIIPVLEDRQEIVLIRQYRIPVAGFVIEFPAGLIDPGEDVGTAALRELLEETGYSGNVEGISPMLSTSAGLSSEGIYLVRVGINGSPQKQALEDSEDIEVLRIPIDKALEELRRRAAEGDFIDSKVWSFLAYAAFWRVNK